MPNDHCNDHQAKIQKAQYRKLSKENFVQKINYS